jgi:hypothetical protein
MSALAILIVIAATLGFMALFDLLSLLHSITNYFQWRTKLIKKELGIDWKDWWDRRKEVKP